MPRALDQRDPAPETGEGLGQFAPDRPGADDGQARRQFGERKYRLVGQVPGLGESRNGRGGGPGAGAEGGPGKEEPGAGHLDGIGTGKSPLPQVEVHSQFVPEAPRRVVSADLRP